MVTILRKKVSKFFQNGHLFLSIFENMVWTFVKKVVVSIMQQKPKKDEKK
jgi:hypothetical protein